MQDKFITTYSYDKLIEKKERLTENSNKRALCESQTTCDPSGKRVRLSRHAPGFEAEDIPETMTTEAFGAALLLVVSSGRHACCQSKIACPFASYAKVCWESERDQHEVPVAIFGDEMQTVYLGEAIPVRSGLNSNMATKLFQTASGMLSNTY